MPTIAFESNLLAILAIAVWLIVLAWLISAGLTLYGSGIILEDRETANGAGEVKPPSVFITAIDGEGFDIASFGHRRLPGVVVGIAEVANRMSEFQRFISLAQTGDGLRRTRRDAT